MKQLPIDSDLETVLNNLALGKIDGDEAKNLIAQLLRTKNKRKDVVKNVYSDSYDDCYDFNMDADPALADK